MMPERSPGSATPVGRRRGEVVKRQPRYLHEVAHCGFAGIRLPVGVTRKARGGVEGEVGRDAGELLRVER